MTIVYKLSRISLYSRFYLVYSPALIWLDYLVIGLEPGVLLSSRCSGLAFTSSLLGNTRTPIDCSLSWDPDLAVLDQTCPVGSVKERHYLLRRSHTSSQTGLHGDILV